MKDQEQRLMHSIRSYYTSTGKLRDLISACEEYLLELEQDEYLNHRAKHASKIAFTIHKSPRYTKEDYENDLLDNILDGSIDGMSEI